MSNFTSPVIMQNKLWLSHDNSTIVDVAEVVERRGCEVEGLGSNLGGFFYFYQQAARLGRNVQG